MSTIGHYTPAVATDIRESFLRAADNATLTTRLSWMPREKLIALIRMLATDEQITEAARKV